MLYIPLSGTFAFETDNSTRWWENNSSFHEFMANNGMQAQEPSFIWSTDLNGIEFWRRWIPIQKLFHTDPQKDYRDWISAGAALSYYCKGMNEVNIIAHSHAYQVVAFACMRYGLQVNNLITVSSPIRSDLSYVYTQARKNIKKHLHIYDGGTFTDRTQILGELGASWLFHPRRRNDFADYNDPVGNINHSKVLSNPLDFKYWLTRGWLNFLRTGNLTSSEVIMK